MKFFAKLLLPFILITAFFSGCNKKNSITPELSIVTTTFPCYDAARAVLGNQINNPAINLKLLVKPGSEVHSYDPTPQDIISIQHSDIFIYIGGESDEWVEKILTSSKNEFKGDELKLIDFVKTINEKDNQNEEDEHIWTSPENEIQIIKTVTNAVLEQSYFSNKSIYIEELNSNSKNYINQIKEVENYTKEIIANSKNKLLVMADRYPFAYFSDYYNLSYDAAFSGCSTAVEASTATIARLISKVKENNLSAVYYIELGNHKIADNVAEACKVDALLLQSGQNLTKDDFIKGETWVTLMKKNADTLSKGLN